MKMSKPYVTILLVALLVITLSFNFWVENPNPEDIELNKANVPSQELIEQWERSAREYAYNIYYEQRKELGLDNFPTTDYDGFRKLVGQHREDALCPELTWRKSHEGMYRAITSPIDGKVEVIETTDEGWNVLIQSKVDSAVVYVPTVSVVSVIEGEVVSQGDVINVVIKSPYAELAETREKNKRERRAELEDLWFNRYKKKP